MDTSSGDGSIERSDSAERDAAAPLLVVAVGASAGGIKAAQQFFANAAADTGAAFVMILHLAPDRDSRLAEILQSVTPMPVMQVRDRVRIERNHVYVIPPDASLTALDGELRLEPPTRPEQRRSPVDVFFRALADAYGSRAVAVVLSGTGPNGSSGIKRVKEHGGLCVAQDPDEAEYADMPRNSIATGVVDYVLRVSEIPRVLREYQHLLLRDDGRGLPPGGGDADADALRAIMTLVRVRTGHDFSNYKPATVRRRIARRMAVLGAQTLADYGERMRGNMDEATALMKELLVSVTSFFRDPEAYEVLEQRIIPKLFEHKRSHDQVRAWVAGCATGEEAYSVAMLLAECAASSDEPPAVQVFATDLDARAIAVAREAIYSDSDVADISEERLRRFFQPTSRGYRVSRELRERVLFATHNVIKDPPFSHIDLIACRNVLIYLNRAVQARLIETLHFALRPGGYLFLGNSETVDANRELFAPAAKAAHVYESRAVAIRAVLPQIDVPLFDRTGPAAAARESRPRDRVSPAELHQRLLEQYAAPSLVVADDNQLVHVSAHAARFLEIAGGEPSRDIVKLAVPELRVDLRTALHQAGRQRSQVEVGGVRLAEARGGGAIRLIVRPALAAGDTPRGYFLVLFEPDVAPPPAPAVQLTSPTNVPVAQLEDELVHVRAQLRATIEQYESQVEEAKASNEELQAMNEELRSAAEELETSKEELQSVNEELATVNQELKIKVEELALTNNDFENFINATDIGTIFLDRSLRVKLSTARAREIFNLVPADVGRRLSDITNTLLVDNLHAEIAGVLERLVAVEREVQTADGRWYMMRILPYRTSDDHIDGVVVTFVDIAALRAAELRARAGEERLRLLIDSAVDYAIFTMTSDGIVDSWNVGAERMFGYSAAEIVGRRCDMLFTPEDRAAGVPKAEIVAALRDGRAADERVHVRRDGERFYCSGVTTRLGERGAYGLAKIARDLTRQRDAQLALAASHDQLESRVSERTLELTAEVARRTTAQEHVASLLRRVVTAQEDQRARIARDLHDQLGQQLTALRLTLERARDRPAAAAAELERAAQIASEIDTELDLLAWELRPALLDDLGLVAALPRYCTEWSEHHHTPVEFRVSGFATGQLLREAELTFYRVAQEALNNIAKHAHATRVDVILETRDRVVVLVIEDDGVGFNANDPAIVTHGLGLVGMRERATLSGASLEVESVEGEGTTVFLRCPVAAPAPESQAREATP